jgi:hypothetical protein
MRLRRSEQERGGYDDLIDLARHQVAPGHYDDVASLAPRTVRSLPCTLAVIAYLTEVCPLIPPQQGAWMVVAHQEVEVLLTADDLLGDWPGGTRIHFIAWRIRSIRTRSLRIACPPT